MKRLGSTSCKVLFLSLFALQPESAFAGAADGYVKKLQGKWRGGGAITINDKGRKVKLRCITTNTLNEGTRTLVLKGRCASSSKTRPLRGTIKYSADGRKISSASLSFAGRSIGAYSSLKGNNLTLNAKVRDPQTKKNVRVRTIVRGGGGRLSIRLLAEDGDKFKGRGTLKFSR